MREEKFRRQKAEGRGLQGEAVARSENEFSLNDGGELNSQGVEPEVFPAKERRPHSPDPGQRAEETTLKSVGLKQGRLVSHATHLDTNLFRLVVNPPTTQVLIDNLNLLPSASCPLPFLVMEMRSLIFRPTLF